MTTVDRWLLPDGVDEILPPQANRVESLRRGILDLYQSWGYELVIPPLIEFLDSLSIVPSPKLQLRTFKIVDQLTGRTLGLRADITSQVARIDAHGLQRPGPTRLCYADSVVHTKPASLTTSRCPIRIGAELYGHAGEASDIEVISLMLETLQVAGLHKTYLAFGHVAIYRSLLEDLGLDKNQATRLFEALQRKASGEIDEILSSDGLDSAAAERLRALPGLAGGIEVLEQARSVLAGAPARVGEAITELSRIATALRERYPEQSLYFDLSELRGYEYHTGTVFAAYVPRHGEAVAKGGRYDDIGKVFGRNRPATGFDADLKVLLSLGGRDFQQPQRIHAPAGGDPALREAIRALRAAGSQVLVELEGQREGARELGCSHELRQVDGRWQPVPLAG